MEFKTRRFTLLTLAALLAVGVQVAQADTSPRGYFGAAFAVERDGGAPWNPTLKAITVTKVSTPSPAATAGIVPGDKIIEVEGRAISGIKVNELIPLANKKVGEQIHVQVQHASGVKRQLTLTAIAKPT